MATKTCLYPALRKQLESLVGSKVSVKVATGSQYPEDVGGNDSEATLIAVGDDYIEVHEVDSEAKETYKLLVPIDRIIWIEYMDEVEEP